MLSRSERAPSAIPRMYDHEGVLQQGLEMVNQFFMILYYKDLYTSKTVASLSDIYAYLSEQ